MVGVAMVGRKGAAATKPAAKFEEGKLQAPDEISSKHLCLRGKLATCGLKLAIDFQHGQKSWNGYPMFGVFRQEIAAPGWQLSLASRSVLWRNPRKAYMSTRNRGFDWPPKSVGATKIG
jgi:hypothetical protein